jgi:hypothetical protein
MISGRKVSWVTKYAANNKITEMVNALPRSRLPWWQISRISLSDWAILTSQ